MILNIGILWCLITNERTLRSCLDDNHSNHSWRYLRISVNTISCTLSAANNEVDFDGENNKTKTDLDTESCSDDRLNTLTLYTRGSCAESICSPHVTFCGRTHCASVYNVRMFCSLLNAWKTKVATVE